MRRDTKIKTNQIQVTNPISERLFPVIADRKLQNVPHSPLPLVLLMSRGDSVLWYTIWWVKIELTSKWRGPCTTLSTGGKGFIAYGEMFGWGMFVKLNVGEKPWLRRVAL